MWPSRAIMTTSHLNLLKLHVQCLQCKLKELSKKNCIPLKYKSAIDIFNPQNPWESDFSLFPVKSWYIKWTENVHPKLISKILHKFQQERVFICIFGKCWDRVLYHPSKMKVSVAWNGKVADKETWKKFRLLSKFISQICHIFCESTASVSNGFSHSGLHNEIRENDGLKRCPMPNAAYQFEFSSDLLPLELISNHRAKEKKTNGG